MAEISREEAIEKIKQNPVYRYECELEEDSQSDLCKALCKSISDMEKLEKIEKIITDIDCSKCGCRDIEEECCDCYKTWFKQIEQISKGE